MSENENESVSFQYWDEMTPEEQERNDLVMWTGKLPDEGGPESVIKYLPLDATAVHTTMRTLETICNALARDADIHRIRNEWECMEVNYLLELLKLRSKSDAGEI